MDIYVLETDLKLLNKQGIKTMLDVDFTDILVNLRHVWLDAARDLAVKPNRDEEEREFGLYLCEAAEKVQELTEMLGVV